MIATLQGPQALARAARPAITLFAALAALAVAASAGGCMLSPRNQAPFTLSNPNERHPIKVSHGEALLDLSVSSRSRGLSEAQWDQIYGYLSGYRERGTGGLVIRAPKGSANETAARRAYQDIRQALSQFGISPRDVRLESYYAKYDPAAPLRLSYLEYVAKGPDCPDWSENLARDPQNLPWPNMGCAMQKNLAAMVADPQDLIGPRAETPRPSERRDVVWGKYVAGESTGSKWSPSDRPLPERTTASEIAPSGGN